MNRNPDECLSRILDDRNGIPDGARCAVVERITGVSDREVCRVSRAICECCCRCLRPGQELNPVVASLVYRAGRTILRAGGMPGCNPAKALALCERVVTHLGVVASGLPDRVFPPETTARAQPAACAKVVDRPKVGGERFIVGLLTAPRATPLLRSTLRSLHSAGFARLHIFAEPGSLLPPEAHRHEVEVHERRLGNFTSFYSALASLYRRSAGADGVLLFQDDIEVALGLKAWCDTELFPPGSGLVSLFTPRVHVDARPGWRVLSPGYFRIWGGQALAFRRDVLEQFLTDPQVLREIQTGNAGDDAVVGGWAARRSLGIALHSPSLVQHVGRVSSLWGQKGPDVRVVAHAVDGVDDISAWKRPPRRPGKVGLVGSCGASGLGYQNEELAGRFEIDRWLVTVLASDAPRAVKNVKCRVDRVPEDADIATLRKWMAGLDWVVVIERPFLKHLASTARSMGVSLAVVANWEWLSPQLDWLRIADVMIAPTRFTYHYLCDWRKRYGFGWEVVYIPWPLDAARFRFRHRRRCERFLFVSGKGGPRGTRLDGTKTPYRRKGTDLMAEVMWAAPRLEFLVCSQEGELPRLPPNARLLRSPADNRKLYEHGDVCVQPSHLEGLGLQLLECQAAGMPLVTTDAPPMNEHNPWVTVPVTGAETVFYGPDQPVPWQQMDSRRLAGQLEDLAGVDISEASLKARAFIENEHSWAQAAEQLRDVFVIP
jgi:glycosyltransferase involved in cell wall biosynthesis